ncbi:MAG: hypothetical protein ACN23H_01670 [Candidatus Phytoplasma vitis]
MNFIIKFNQSNENFVNKTYYNLDDSIK